MRKNNAGTSISIASAVKKIEIINGDAILEMKKITSNSIDLIIADPPYNLGKDYGNNSDSKDFKDYISI